ncbi:hypothetical protein JCM11641_007572 [Rhodosporidiobolus odoratus]
MYRPRATSFVFPSTGRKPSTPSTGLNKAVGSELQIARTAPTSRPAYARHRRHFTVYPSSPMLFQDLKSGQGGFESSSSASSDELDWSTPPLSPSTSGSQRSRISTPDPKFMVDLYDSFRIVSPGSGHGQGSRTFSSSDPVLPFFPPGLAPPVAGQLPPPPPVRPLSASVLGFSPPGSPIHFDVNSSTSTFSIPAPPACCSEYPPDDASLLISCAADPQCGLNWGGGHHHFQAMDPPAFPVTSYYAVPPPPFESPVLSPLRCGQSPSAPIYAEERSLLDVLEHQPVTSSGKVNRFDVDQGYGFIMDYNHIGLGSTEVFVHYSNIVKSVDFRCLSPGEVVEYTLIKHGSGRLQAFVLTGTHGMLSFLQSVKESLRFLHSSPSFSSPSARPSSASRRAPSTSPDPAASAGPPATSTSTTPSLSPNLTLPP